MKQIIAAISFFTRLPLWRIVNIEKKYYERVVPIWPMTGWLTGGLMAIIYWMGMMVFPITVSVMLAVAARVILTGALHEDGFADFCDGFGGGNNREQTLAIMKDSRIGTYGVLGLVLYYLIMTATLNHLLPLTGCPLLFMAADSLCKTFCSTIIWFLPYARNEQSAKNQLVYAGVKWRERIISIVFGLLPLLLIPSELYIYIGYAAIGSIAVCALLFIWMYKRLQGYTGDCCGAAFIIAELTFYLVMLGVIN